MWFKEPRPISLKSRYVERDLILSSTSTYFESDVLQFCLVIIQVLRRSFKLCTAYKI
jgi:hypothetical protein